MAPQNIKLLIFQFKHTIFWEAFYVPANLSLELLCFHLVEVCQIPVQHHVLIPYQINFTGAYLVDTFYFSVQVLQLWQESANDIIDSDTLTHLNFSTMSGSKSIRENVKLII